MFTIRNKHSSDLINQEVKTYCLTNFKGGIMGRKKLLEHLNKEQIEQRIKLLGITKAAKTEDVSYNTFKNRADELGVILKKYKKGVK